SALTCRRACAAASAAAPVRRRRCGASGVTPVEATVWGARVPARSRKTLLDGVTLRQGRVTDPGECAEVRRGFRAAHGARAASDPGRLRHLSAAVADCEFRHR